MLRKNNRNCIAKFLIFKQCRTRNHETLSVKIVLSIFREKMGYEHPNSIHFFLKTWIYFLDHFKKFELSNSYKLILINRCYFLYYIVWFHKFRVVVKNFEMLIPISVNTLRKIDFMSSSWAISIFKISY